MWGDISLWFCIAFPWWLARLSSFSCAAWSYAFPLGKVSFQFFCPFFKEKKKFVCLFVCLFDDIQLYELFIYYCYSVTSTLVTPWTAAHQASLSFTLSQSLLKFMSIEPVMPSNHLILHHPLLLLHSSLSQQQHLFQWVGSSHQVAKFLEFQLHHQFFQWILRVGFL